MLAARLFLTVSDGMSVALDTFVSFQAKARAPMAEADPDATLTQPELDTSQLPVDPAVDMDCNSSPGPSACAG
jgi:hypothetical protein